MSPRSLCDQLGPFVIRRFGLFFLVFRFFLVCIVFVVFFFLFPPVGLGLATAVARPSPAALTVYNLGRSLGSMQCIPDPSIKGRAGRRQSPGSHER